MLGSIVPEMGESSSPSWFSGLKCDVHRFGAGGVTDETEFES